MLSCLAGRYTKRALFGKTTLSCIKIACCTAPQIIPPYESRVAAKCMISLVRVELIRYQLSLIAKLFQPPLFSNSLLIIYLERRHISLVIYRLPTKDISNPCVRVFWQLKWQAKNSFTTIGEKELGRGVFSGQKRPFLPNSYAGPIVPHESCVQQFY